MKLLTFKPTKPEYRHLDWITKKLQASPTMFVFVRKGVIIYVYFQRGEQKGLRQEKQRPLYKWYQAYQKGRWGVVSNMLPRCLWSQNVREHVCLDCPKFKLLCCLSEKSLNVRTDVTEKISEGQKVRDKDTPQISDALTL